MGAIPTESKNTKAGFNGPGHAKTKFDLEATYSRGSGKNRQEIRISTSTVANRVTLKKAKAMASEWLRLTLPREIRASEHVNPYTFMGFSGTCQALNHRNEVIKTYTFEPLTQEQLLK